MYEPVSEGSYIKMIDMVSGGGKMEVSSQFKPKENVQKDLFFLYGVGISLALLFHTSCKLYAGMVWRIFEGVYSLCCFFCMCR